MHNLDLATKNSYVYISYVRCSKKGERNRAFHFMIYILIEQSYYDLAYIFNLQGHAFSARL